MDRTIILSRTVLQSLEVRHLLERAFGGRGRASSPVATRHGRARRVALVIGMSLLLIAARAASAAPTLVTDAYRLAGRGSDLSLVGPETLVGTYEGSGTDVVRSFRDGAGSKAIASVRFEEYGEAFHDSLSFSASAARLTLLDQAVNSSRDGGEGFAERLISGPLAGALSGLTVGCPRAAGLGASVYERISPHTAVAGDGEVVAYDSFGCLVIKDFSSGLQRIVPLEATLDPVQDKRTEELPQGALLRVAGRLVAYRANPFGGEGPSSVVVYDIDTGHELYRVPMPPEASPFSVAGQSDTFDLQSDGTLVLADPVTCSATVSTIAEPSPRALGLPACYVRRVRGGLVLLVAPGPSGQRLLEWTPIEAPEARVIAGLGTDRDSGSRLARNERRGRRVRAGGLLSEGLPCAARRPWHTVGGSGELSGEGEPCDSHLEIASRHPPLPPRLSWTVLRLDRHGRSGASRKGRRIRRPRRRRRGGAAHHELLPCARP